jgi:Flp pilus assembly protein TadD
VLGEAATARPGQVILLDALGKLLLRQGPSRLGNAIEYLRAARAQRPGLGIALSAALISDRRAKEAEGVLRDLLRQQRETPMLQSCLGVCLDAQNKHGAAEAAYRKAIALDPDFADAYGNLGMCLADQQRYEAAERACRTAVDLRPDRAAPYYCLGYVLDQRKNHAAAAAAYRKAIALRPDWADAHYNLGIALDRQGDPGAAAAAFREAIALRPDFAPAHNNLGIALSQQQKPGAEEAFRKGIALRPDSAEAHNNLGMALGRQGEHGEAEAAFRKAIALRPAFALAYFNLAHALTQQARFGEALAFAQKGYALLPARDPLRAEARPLLQQCERYKTLDARLPSILRGAAKPANPAEQIELAQLCVLKKLYAAAAHFYNDAFTEDPKRGEDVPAGHRYNAACVAALAGCAQGQDADRSDDRERTRWRRQALDWLRQDLTWWGKALDDGNAQTSAQVRQQLRLWQGDPDLAGVRARDALARLPDEEREGWQRLWSDVEALLRRLGVPE